MENSAQTLTKHFTVCATCSGLGISRGGSSGNRPDCPSCQGTGVMLVLPLEDFALSLPLYVDFGGRLRRRAVKSALFVLLLTFLFGIPYLLITALTNFWQSLKGGL